MNAMPDPKDKPLRVLLVSPAGRGGNGGIDRLMDALCDELARHGHANEVETTRIVSRGPRLMASVWHMPLAMVRMSVLALSGRADVVHVNLSSSGSTLRKIILCRLARLLGVPYVLHLHSGRYREFWTASPRWLQAAIGDMFANADRVIVLGGVWAELAREIAPQATRQIMVLASATQSRGARRRPPSDSACRIVFTGKLGTAKGVPLLVEALAKLRDLSNWSAVVAGDGEVEATRRMVRSLGLQERIEVPGWLDGKAIDALLSSADILALPSQTENLPMSVIEAMANGLAIVTTPVGAIPDIIEDGVTGLFVEPGNAGQLSDALAHMIHDPALRRKLGQNARAYQQAHLDAANYAKRMVDIWRDCAKPRARRVQEDAPLGGSARRS
ncbi:MAG: glycosyltransferase family 4 protein [Rhodobiaceae bacterium]|nr:glycosyltransferase family 4 protein [Rhodobiaceae bacterium]